MSSVVIKTTRFEKWISKFNKTEFLTHFERLQSIFWRKLSFHWHKHTRNWTKLHTRVLFCYVPIGRSIQGDRGERSGANAVLLWSTGTDIGLSQHGTKISKFNTRIFPYA